MDASRNSIRLHCLEMGHGPPVMLLHGFPDGMPTWRAQLPALVDAGFRVIAPALRGYGNSDKPRGVAAYDIDQLADDIATLIEARAAKPLAALVGHDWGGAIAWQLAARHPPLVERLVILNAPHPAALARGLRHPAQLLRSWYTFFFQLPWLPERLLSARNYRLIRRAIEQNLQHATLSEEDWREHLAEIAVPGALTAALNYYRAAARRMVRGRRGANGPRANVECKTLVLWGERDAFLRTSLLDGLPRWVPRVEVRRVADAGHWVHWDAPQIVNDAILQFLARSP